MDNKIVQSIVAFFIPPLGVILKQRTLGMDFWINLILTLLFWLPGFLHALYLIWMK